MKAEALDDVHAPELVNRFLDVVTVQKSTALLLLDGVNLVFGTLIGMLLLALYHPILLLFSAVLLVLIVIVLWICGRGAVDTSIKESRMKYDLVNWFEEIAHFPLLFKGPGGHSMAYERANQFASEYVTARAAHFRILMRQVAGLLTLQVFAAAGLLGVGGWLVISQQITLGQLVASELILSTIVASLAKLGKKLEAWCDAMAAMDKLGHIVDLPIEREDGEQPERREGGAEVIAKGLTFGYLEGSPLFAERSFHIRPGTRACITGPHGAGASSLLDILFGLRQPTGGFVTIDGLDLRTWYSKPCASTSSSSIATKSSMPRSPKTSASAARISAWTRSATRSPGSVCSTIFCTVPRVSISASNSAARRCPATSARGSSSPARSSSVRGCF